MDGLGRPLTDERDAKIKAINDWRRSLKIPDGQPSPYFIHEFGRIAAVNVRASWAERIPLIAMTDMKSGSPWWMNE